MLVYISGPMTGRKNLNKKAFDSAFCQLLCAGYDAINPHDLDLLEHRDTWEDCLKRDLRELVQCNGVATLPDWRRSRGAKLEVYVAKKLKIPVHPVAWYTKRGGK